MGIIILAVVIGLLHILLQRLYSKRRQIDLSIVRSNTIDGVTALVCGVILYFLSGGLVSLLVDAALNAFAGDYGDISASLTPAAQNIFALLASMLTVSSLPFMAMLMTGACVIVISAGKRSYLFLGSLFYIATVFFMLVSTVAVIVATPELML